MRAIKTMVGKYSNNKILFQFYRSKKITAIEGANILETCPTSFMHLSMRNFMVGMKLH